VIEVAVMDPRLDLKWWKILQQLDFAFQPIVNVHTGMAYGFEALLRGWDKAGFTSIQHVFDSAFSDQQLYGVDLALRSLAMDKFLQTGFHTSTKLFYNLDNRVLAMPDYSPGNTIKLCYEKGLSPTSICFELSERHILDCYDEPIEILEAYKKQQYRIAIDDFGSGYSGLQLLYQAEPDIVKLDRFFIQTLQADAKKKLFLTHLVNMAHVMGILVIAEGVETEEEFYACRDIGCELVQGYLIQRPTQNVEDLMVKYPLVEKFIQKNRRYHPNTKELIYQHTEKIEAVSIEEPVLSTLDIFRKDTNLSFIPMVNEASEPLGILREKDLRSYIFSPVGISLLQNTSFKSQNLDFLTRVPIVEIYTRIEKILELYTMAKDVDAILLTENGKYLGVLNSRTLIQIFNEKQLNEARDQNPLSRLPGNTVISEYLMEVLNTSNGSTLLVYFDFNNFKPFNDTYGFRQGDRVILLFADLLREASIVNRWFVGHIGGDDFFMGVSCHRTQEIEEHLSKVHSLIDKFAEDVRAFYPKKDRDRGSILAKDRNGRWKRFPLLTVSACAVCIKQGKKEAHSLFSIDSISERIALLKAEAKKSRIFLVVDSSCQEE
jgi:diguanylate cyclase (GGDEF)-like protein